MKSLLFVMVSYTSEAAERYFEITDEKPTRFFQKLKNNVSLKKNVPLSEKKNIEEMLVQVPLSLEGYAFYSDNIFNL